MLLFLFFRVLNLYLISISWFWGLKNTHPEKENYGRPPRLQDDRPEAAEAGPEARAPGGAGRGRGCPAAHWAHLGPHPLAASKKSKFPKYGLQPASGNHIQSGGGTPGPPPPVTPEHRATPLGLPSPCPGDHRKCQQGESQENSPLAQSKGAGC